MKGILDGKRLAETIQDELTPRINALLENNKRRGLGVI